MTVKILFVLPTFIIPKGSQMSDETFLIKVYIILSILLA